MSKQQASYRDIFKATSLFGGVQVFNIIIRVIRSKFVAVLLGPEGMGISGLLNSTILLIGQLTNFGLGISAVKNVAAANGAEDSNRLAIVVTAMRRWVWLTGLLGSLVSLVLSSWLSEITFGNSDYTLAFVWISITILFKQLSTGQLVLLQGLRKMQYLAKANLFGSLVGLVITVPLYYKWGIDGIVPAIILSSVIAMSLSWYYARKVEVKKVKMSPKTTFFEGKEMLRMGVVLNAGWLFATGATYLIRIYISREGGLEEVGLYTAGVTIISTYAGMVLNAMSTDYYPRLSSVAHNNEKARKLINQQAEIAILIMAPLLAVFLVYINIIITILYSAKFLPIIGMVHWAAIGMFFKALSWSVAYILMAKSESRLFFWNELIANAYALGLNILGYYWGGLTGLGLSFLIGYFLYFVQMYFLVRKKYSFSFNTELIKIFALQLTLGILIFCVVKLVDKSLAYGIGSLLIMISTGYSYRELDQRMGIKNLLRSIIKR